MKACKPHNVYPDFSCTLCHDQSFYQTGFKEIGWKEFRGIKKMQYQCDKGHVTTNRQGQGTERAPFKCGECERGMK